MDGKNGRRPASVEADQCTNARRKLPLPQLRQPWYLINASYPENVRRKSPQISIIVLFQLVGPRNNVDCFSPVNWGAGLLYRYGGAKLTKYYVVPIHVQVGTVDTGGSRAAMFYTQAIPDR